MTENTSPEDKLDERPDDQLAFSRIKTEIENTAKDKANEILQNSKLSIEEILSTAEEKANMAKSDIIGSARNQAINAKIREISRRKLALKMDYLETREQIINEIQLETKSKLQKYTQTEDYSKFMQMLVKTSGISIGGGQLKLHLRAEDKSHFTKDSLSQIAKDIHKETNQETNISISSEALITMGGIKLIRHDNRLFVDNTFESRLEREKDSIRVALQEVLS